MGHSTIGFLLEYQTPALAQTATRPVPVRPAQGEISRNGVEYDALRPEDGYAYSAFPIA